VAIAVVVLIVALLLWYSHAEIMEEELVVERQTHTGKKII